jgi:hypothetical protein
MGEQENKKLVLFTFQKMRKDYIGKIPRFQKTNLDTLM